MLLVTQTPGEPLGGVYAGPCVRTGDRMEAGQAFVRAYIRAINTYLPPDYQDDAEVMAALAEETGAAGRVARSRPRGLYFDWEMRTNTSQNAQKYFIEFETVEYERRAHRRSGHGPLDVRSRRRRLIWFPPVVLSLRGFGPGRQGHSVHGDQRSNAGSEAMTVAS